MGALLTILKLLRLESIVSKFTGFTPGGFLIKHWKWVAILVLILAVVADHYYLVAEVNLKEAKIQKLEKDNAQCLANNATLSKALTDQTSLIKYWAGVDRNQAAQIDQLKQQLAEKKKQSDAAVEEIKKEPKLKSCEDAMHYLFDAAKNPK